MTKGNAGKQKQDKDLKNKINEKTKYIREFARNNDISISVAKAMLLNGEKE